jgi:tripartite-type tricarboxylate transporter receptor subunit TctC
MVAQKLNETWKQPVFIEHRPGASGSIAVELTVKSPPDGHTLVFATAGQIVINPHILKLNYDQLVIYAGGVSRAHLHAADNASVVPARCGELIALASAARQAQRSVRRHGVPSHLAAELFMSLTGTRMTHIPFKGAGPSILAVVTGDIDLSFGSLPATMGQAKAGRVRALGVSTTKRTPVWPDLPTLAESGAPGYEMTSWYAFFRPSRAKTRSPAFTRYRRVAAQPDFRSAWREVRTRRDDPERFGQFMRVESARWGKSYASAISERSELGRRATLFGSPESACPDARVSRTHHAPFPRRRVDFVRHDVWGGLGLRAVTARDTRMIRTSAKKGARWLNPGRQSFPGDLGQPKGATSTPWWLFS